MTPIGAEVGNVSSALRLRANINSGRQQAFSDWKGYVAKNDYQPVKRGFEVLAGETVTTYAQTGDEESLRKVDGTTDVIIGAVDGGTVWDEDNHAHPLKKGEIWTHPVTNVRYVGK